MADADAVKFAKRRQEYAAVYDTYWSACMSGVLGAGHSPPFLTLEAQIKQYVELAVLVREKYLQACELEASAAGAPGTPEGRRISIATVYDRYMAAALTGILSGSKAHPNHVIMIEQARSYVEGGIVSRSRYMRAWVAAQQDPAPTRAPAIPKTASPSQPTPAAEIVMTASTNDLGLEFDSPG